MKKLVLLLLVFSFTCLATTDAPYPLNGKNESYEIAIETVDAGNLQDFIGSPDLMIKATICGMDDEDSKDCIEVKRAEISYNNYLKKYREIKIGYYDVISAINMINQPMMTLFGNVEETVKSGYKLVFSICESDGMFGIQCNETDIIDSEGRTSSTDDARIVLSEITSVGETFTIMEPYDTYENIKLHIRKVIK